MKYIFGLAAALIGFFIGVAGLNLSARPDNAPLTLAPTEALSTYFFSFSWVGGTLGALIGAGVLLAYLALWYCFGTVVHARFANRRN